MSWRGVSYPLAWVHGYGRGQVVYIALGHDVDAYASKGTRELVRRAAAWLLEAKPHERLGA